MRGALCDLVASARPSLLQQGNDPVAQEITIVRVVPIGVVLDPVDPGIPQIILQGPGVEAQQGTSQRSLAEVADPWHPGEAIDAAATHQVQQNGFRLVVRMVGRKQQISGCQKAHGNVVPQTAGLRFQSRP